MNPIGVALALAVVGRLIYRVFIVYKEGVESMYVSNKEITQFHDEEVRLPQSTQDMLRKHRKSNQDRLTKGLDKNDRPAVKDFVKQGSYAMYTINQHPENDYDIDDGASFDKSDLAGARDAEMTALDARQMVRDAVDDGTFKDEVNDIYLKCSTHSIKCDI